MRTNTRYCPFCGNEMRISRARRPKKRGIIGMLFGNSNETETYSIATCTVCDYIEDIN